ncbi:hypothetical protein ACOME3_006201 [Neoechinorhynchus agilis]
MIFTISVYILLDESMGHISISNRDLSFRTFRKSMLSLNLLVTFSFVVASSKWTMNHSLMSIQKSLDTLQSKVLKVQATDDTSSAPTTFSTSNLNFTTMINIKNNSQEGLKSVQSLNDSDCSDKKGSKYGRILAILSAVICGLIIFGYTICALVLLTKRRRGSYGFDT